MALSRSAFDLACLRLHRIGGLSHRVCGIAVPHMVLIAADLTAHVFEVPDAIADAAGSARAARAGSRDRRGRAACSVEAWLGFVGIPSEGFEPLAPQGLPRASEMPDRREALTTTSDV